VLISSLIAGGSLLTLSLAALVWESSQDGTATTPDLTNISATATAQNSQATPTSVSQQAVVPANGDTNWSADLRYAVVDNSSKNQLEVYAVSPQKLLCTIPYNSIPYSYHYSFDAVSWSADNSKFLMYPYVLETKTGRKLYTLVSPSSQEPSYTPFARWSPDGRSIVWNTSSYNQDYNTVTLTNATNGKTLVQKTFPGTNIASCIAWSPDSRSIAFPNTDSSTWTVGQPWSVGIVDIATFKQVGTLSDTLPASPFLNASSFASASGIAWSPEGTRIAVTINDHAWIFTVEKTTTNFFVLAPTSFSVPLYAVPVWSPDSSFVAFYSDTSLSVYNTQSNTSQTLINESQPSNVMALAWSDDSQSITSADDKNRLFTWTIQ
jgi:hypothetical protein